MVKEEIKREIFKNFKLNENIYNKPKFPSTRGHKELQQYLRGIFMAQQCPIRKESQINETDLHLKNPEKMMSKLSIM